MRATCFATKTVASLPHCSAWEVALPRCRRAAAVGPRHTVWCAGMTTRLGLKFYFEMNGNHPRHVPTIAPRGGSRPFPTLSTCASQPDRALGVTQAMRNRGHHTGRPSSDCRHAAKR
jgi:hypothetical protein